MARIVDPSTVNMVDRRSVPSFFYFLFIFFFDRQTVEEK